MCVIAICTSDRATEEMVNQMWEANKFGGGVAWREQNREGRKLVRFKKGINEVKEMVEFAAELPLPHVLHFRIPSVGKDCDALTHPFIISEESPVDQLEGETENPVLFHNGTWGSWRAELKIAAISGAWKIPPGELSDSRAMAIMAARMGLGILELIDEKVVVFGPDEIRTFHDSGWTFSSHIMFSNMGWKPYTKSGRTGGSSQSSYFQQSGGGQDDRRAGGEGSSAGGSYHTSCPASMAGGHHERELTGGPAADIPFGETGPTRKVLRRLRRKQERTCIQRGLTTPAAIYPSSVLEQK